MTAAPASADGAPPAPGEAASASSPGGPAKRPRRWLRWLIALFVMFLLLVGAAVLYVALIPFPAPAPKPQATIVYDAAGQQLATFSEQNRVNVPLAEVAPVVVDAVISTEDRHFYREGGVNPISIVRAGLADVSGHRLQGGSTITQQYVKQLYLNPKRTIGRKIEEAGLAIRLGQTMPKKQILQGYLNTIYWGRGSYGVEAAARAFFGKDAHDLGLPEASLLAAIIKDPETADPARNPHLAQVQQASTLKGMVRDKKITAAQAAAVEQMPYSAYVIPPPSVVSQAQSSALGLDYFLEAVHQQLYAQYGRQAVDGGGLRVTTTFDPKMQQLAYNTLYGTDHNALNPAKGDPSAAIVSMDDTGQVKALVGGQNYAQSTVDLALGAAGGGSGRQPGSTFKAIMLAEVLREGYSVLSPFPAPPKVVVPGGNAGGAPWTVSNYEGEAVSPTMNLVDATALSVNTVYAQVVAKIGADKLDTMAEAMGINPNELKGAYDSQVLGSADVSPLEMTAAFATIADGGVYHSPILVTKVLGPDGKDHGLPVVPVSRQVLTPQQAAVEDYVLQQVVARGTGVAAGNVGSPVAGKTGTTQIAGDAWFVGYTPKLTTSVWMGYAASEKSMDGFRIPFVSGGSFPAQFWHDYMAAVLSGEPQYAGAFPAPGDLGGTMLVPWQLNGDVVSVGTSPASTLPTTVPTTAPTTTVPAPSTTTSPTTAPAPGPTTHPGTLPPPTTTATVPNPPTTRRHSTTSAPATTAYQPPTTVYCSSTTTAPGPADSTTTVPCI